MQFYRYLYDQQSFRQLCHRQLQYLPDHLGRLLTRTVQRIKELLRMYTRQASVSQHFPLLWQELFSMKALEVENSME